VGRTRRSWALECQAGVAVAVVGAVLGTTASAFAASPATHQVEDTLAPTATGKSRAVGAVLAAGAPVAMLPATMAAIAAGSLEGELRHLDLVHLGTTYYSCSSTNSTCWRAASVAAESYLADWP